MIAEKIPYLKQVRPGCWRWEPGKDLRARGFHGRNLKDETGAWLPKYRAMEEAAAINATLRSGPDDAATVHTRAPASRSVAALCQAFRARGKMQNGDGPPSRRRLAARTRKSYEAHLALIEAWAGRELAAAIPPADVEDFYHVLAEERGEATANAVMRTMKALFYFGGIKGLRWYAFNPVAGLELVPLAGRLVLWQPQEIAALLGACDFLVAHGFYWAESVGDAVVLALMTGQRAGDLLAMPPLELETGVYRIVQSKTGAVAYVPQSAPLTARLDRMAKWRGARWPNVAFKTQLVRPDGTAWPAEGSSFRDAFAAVRTIAAGEAGATLSRLAIPGPGAVTGLETALRALGGLPPLLRNARAFEPMPSCAAKRFQDFRDTAVTWLFDATHDIAKVATVTGHSLKTAQTIVDKHYYVRQAEQAVAAGLLLAASPRLALIGR